MNTADSLAETASDNAPISRAALAALVMGLTRELSGARQAYHVCLSVLAERDLELKAQSARYAELLDEHRRLRADLMRKAAAA
jgi:hypothetical protein